MEWTTGNTITVFFGAISVTAQVVTFAYFIGKLKSVQDSHEKRMKELEDEFYSHQNNDSKHANKARDAEFEKRIEERFNQSDSSIRELKMTISQNFQTTQALIESLKPNRSRNRE
jgi:Sec-independent protein translocase protein TatA